MMDSWSICAKCGQVYPSGPTAPGHVCVDKHPVSFSIVPLDNRVADLERRVQSLEATVADMNRTIDLLLAELARLK